MALVLGDVKSRLESNMEFALQWKFAQLKKRKYKFSSGHPLLDF